MLSRVSCSRARSMHPLFTSGNVLVGVISVSVVSLSPTPLSFTISPPSFLPRQTMNATHICDFARLHPLLDGRAVDDGEAEHAGARLGKLLHRGRPEVEVGEDEVRAPVNDSRSHGLEIEMGQ